MPDDLTQDEIARAESSPDNNYVGTEVVPPKPGEEEESNYTPVFVEDGAEQLFSFFKHRTTARFEIPRGNGGDPWKFVNHIAKIRNEEVSDFIEACRGLHRSDSGNIFKIRNIQNEVAIDLQPQAFRSPASTQTIVARTADGPAGLEAPAAKLNPAPQRPAMRLGART